LMDLFKNPKTIMLQVARSVDPATDHWPLKNMKCWFGMGNQVP